MKEKLLQLLESDRDRMQLLRAARALDLPDWCIAAGFVRNLVWDYLHGYQNRTPLNDVDLIYFDNSDISVARDELLEQQLQKSAPCRWSVKNQARMHIRNHDSPYLSSQDAMSYWPEVETAVGVKLKNNGELELISPFSTAQVISNTITVNPHKPQPAVFNERITLKGWLTRWPQLKVKGL